MEKSMWFKKIVVFSCLIFSISVSVYGQKTLPVYDGITYSAGTLAYDNINWWCLNASPTNDVGVTAGSLTYDGLLASTGNKLSIGGAGDDIAIWFGDQAADTKIYYSFIMQVTDMTGIGASSPANITGFSNSHTAAGTQGGSIFLQKDATDATKFNIGHAARASLTPLWNNVSGVPVKYSLNTPIFVVVCYEIIGTFIDGTPNDKSSLWINPSPSTFENEVPPAASVSFNLTGTPTNDVNPLNSYYIRQDAASNTPSLQIDEIRMGLSWAVVTPKSISTGINDISSNKIEAIIYPNPGFDIVHVNLNSSEICSMEVYNLIGVKVLSNILDPGINTVDISKLPKGTYIVSFKGNGNSYTRKFLKN